MSAPAPFKTQEDREYWIEGFSTPIYGHIDNVEFVENGEGKIVTFLTIVNKTRRYRVKLSAIAVSGEDLKAA